jgi:thiamine-monophosphate kinase
MTDGGTVAGLGEDALVRRILGRYGPMPAFVRVGPGDDAAVLDLAGPVVASTDTLVEGRDFLRRWSDGVEVGVKVAAQNFADIAAMGARPVALLVSLAAPRRLPSAFADELARGLDDECRRAGASVVGGDVSDADCLVITGTALGVLDGPVVLRSKARIGDTVAIAGAVGPSAAGLALLRAGFGVPDDPEAGTDHGHGRHRPVAPGWLTRLVAAHRAPRPGYAAGPLAAAAGAGALIDTSDGLVRDVARLATASGVVVDLDPAAVRRSLGEVVADLDLAADRLGDRSLVDRWVYTGGEDHALVGCFPAGSALPAGFRPIGLVRERAEPSGDPAGALRVLVGGRPWAGESGWQHWS